MEEFGDLAFRKKNLLTELMGFDAREELLGLSHEEQLCHIPQRRHRIVGFS